MSFTKKEFMEFFASEHGTQDMGIIQRICINYTQSELEAMICGEA